MYVVPREWLSTDCNALDQGIIVNVVDNLIWKSEESMGSFNLF